MHDLFDRKFRNTVNTIVLSTLSAYPAVAEAAEPFQAIPPLYFQQNKQSYSEVAQSIKILDRLDGLSDFASGMKVFFRDLSDGQAPLGSEFEAIWDANVDQLYEA